MIIRCRPKQLAHLLELHHKSASVASEHAMRLESRTHTYCWTAKADSCVCVCSQNGVTFAKIDRSKAQNLIWLTCARLLTRHEIQILCLCVRASVRQDKSWQAARFSGTQVRCARNIRALDCGTQLRACVLACSPLIKFAIILHDALISQRHLVVLRPTDTALALESWPNKHAPKQSILTNNFLIYVS